jgi:hypothetical protein
MQRQGVPCHTFEPQVLHVLGQLSKPEAAAFASIWHKANTDGLNRPGGAGVAAGDVGWIFGKAGY